MSHLRLSALRLACFVSSAIAQLFEPDLRLPPLALHISIKLIALSLIGNVALCFGGTIKPQRNVNGPLKVHMPVVFEPNRGQANPQAQWIATGDSFQARIDAESLVLNDRNRPTNAHVDARAADADSALRLHFLGAETHAQSVGITPLSGKSNYYLGNRQDSWHLGIPTFGGVRYRGIYPGIDITYHARGGQIEYDFIVSPGAAVSRIRLAFEGKSSIRLTKSGDLETFDGAGLQRAPVAYQLVAGARKFVKVRYVIERDGPIGFALGDYDRSKSIVIDPIIFSYWSGSPFSYHSAVATDPTGAVYIAGGATPGLGYAKAEIYKIDFSTGTIVYHTVLDGHLDDISESLAVDANGNAYVAGSTDSTDFPTHNAFQATYGGGSFDGFVAKLDSSGSVVYSTYLGGLASDTVSGVAVDADGSAYLTGTTSSSNFPATPPISSISGASDAFVTKFSADGLSLAYSNVFGGSGNDAGVKVAVDSFKAAYVIGNTNSTNYPTTTGVLQTAVGHVFVSKLDPTGASFTYATYFGGTLPGSGAGGIAVDSFGDAFLTGTSQNSDFPQVAPIFSGVDCANQAPCVYVSELNPSGTALIYSSPLQVAGGVGEGVQSNSIAIDTSGNAYITGSASSGFPVTSPQLASFLGASFGTSLWDAFISEVAAGGASLVFSTYLGSNGVDIGYGVAVDSTGNIYAIGDSFVVDTGSEPFIPASLSFGSIGFLAKLSSAANYPTPTLDAVIPATALAGTSSFSVAATGVNFAPNATLQWNGSNLTTTIASGTQLTAQIPSANVAQAQTAQITVTNPAPGGGASAPVSFTVTNPTPVASILSPSNAAAGSTALTLTVDGTGFLSNSAVDWNGSPRTTTFVSSAQLQAAISAADLQTSGSKSVTVVNPAPGGGTSNTLTFNVTGSSPTYALSASPTSATIRAGQSVSIALTVTAAGGFNSPVTFSCSALPAMSSCAFNPSSVTPNGSPVTSTLVITTTGSAALFTPRNPTNIPPARLLTFAMLALMGFGFVSCRVRRKLLVPYLAVWIFVGIGCGGGGYSQSSASTPAGTSTVTVSAVSGSNVQTLAVTITVTP